MAILTGIILASYTMFFLQQLKTRKYILSYFLYLTLVPVEGLTTSILIGKVYSRITYIYEKLHFDSIALYIFKIRHLRLMYI